MSEYEDTKRDARIPSCDMAPPGWQCSRPRGHGGPCAARLAPSPVLDASDEPMPRPRITVSRTVHYWTEEAGKLIPNAAIVVALATDGRRVWLHVFWAGGYGGNDRVWASFAEVPTEGRWTWPERV